MNTHECHTSKRADRAYRIGDSRSGGGRTFTSVVFYKKTSLVACSKRENVLEYPPTK